MPKAYDAMRFLTFSYFGGKTQSALSLKMLASWRKLI
jgi:hypothetical protein